MKRKQSIMKWSVLISVPIISCVIIGSLVMYVNTWLTNGKLLVINENTSGSYIPFVVALLLSVAFNIGLTVYYVTSMNKVKKLVENNCYLSEMILKLQMKSTDKILEAMNGGEK